MRLSAFVAGLGWVSAFAAVWCVFLSIGDAAWGFVLFIFSVGIAIGGSGIAASRKEPTGYPMDVTQFAKRGRNE